MDWTPKTKLGKMVLSGEIKSIDEILDRGIRITEPEIVDYFLPNLQSELILVGQMKGKFGGGQRRPYRSTKKTTAEGKRVKFTAYAVVGNGDGYIGLGWGSARETLPAREKAVANAKKNLIKIKRGCGSWECACASPHSIPVQVEGKEGSVRLVLMPAPKGIGLCINNECKKIMKLAGIKDIWSRSFGKTRTRINLVKACFDALKKLSKIKIRQDYYSKAGIKEGSLK
ncbi:MAG TPA: 30S ribosomal protein S5 [Candidatus Aenigmarchaeota archaeon]|nr:30S ribosomal protein S5 [Candidatus Aenigmarchaeota archaeon]HEX32861.1 30S ribosomal protein S5 [Candidatus Aenigmarchaeota archaeon]